MRYDFYLDRKQTCWEREHFHVEADTEELAKIEAVKQYDGEIFIDPDFYTTLDDTAENMRVQENGGFSTIELYDGSGKLIIENGLNLSNETA